MLKLTPDRDCKKHFSKDKIHFYLFLIATMFCAIACPQHIAVPFMIYNTLLLQRLLEATKNSCWY
jgi:hypothetical protein